MRIATITLAAPWPANVTTGMFNRHQPNGLNEIGHTAEVFVMSPQFPRFLERWRPSLRGFRERPAEYEFMNVKFHAIKGWVAHQTFARMKVAPRFPRLAGRLVCWHVERRLLKALRQFKPDGLLVHDTIVNGALAARLSRKLGGIPYVLIDHDIIDMDPNSPMGRHYVRVASKARVIFNVGILGHRHNRDVLRLQNARMLPNGTASPTAEQRNTPRPAKWDGKKVVLCVGDMRLERKGHRELLKAFAEANVPDAHLLLMGDRRPDLVELIAELKLGDKVEFIPPQKQQDVQQYMVWADLFCLPSWWECAALVYIEAMSAETPPIMTTDCGLTYVVEQGVNGWVVPPKDHATLVQVLRDALTKADLKAMGTRGRELAESRFVWTKNAELVVAAMRGEPDPLPPIREDIALPKLKPA